MPSTAPPAASPPASPATASGTAPSSRALILFGHGSRDARWAAPMEAVAARMRQLHPGAQVACAYLELMEPCLALACQRAVAHGARHITVLPMFLGQGRHAREDLPELLAEQHAQHPGVAFELRTALGEDPAMVEAIALWALRDTIKPA